VGKAARVTSIDALKDFKRVLGDFTTAATTALGEADADVRRTTWWIEHEQRSYWQNHRRKWANRLAEAKKELFSAQMAAGDRLVPATLQRKAVEKAQREVDEADTKLKNIKRWSRLLERETILYRGDCQQLGRALEGDLPQALARLEQMIDALERYVKLPAPVLPEEAGIQTVSPETDEAEAGVKPPPPEGQET
jgi:hypothetical protein